MTARLGGHLLEMYFPFYCITIDEYNEDEKKVQRKKKKKVTDKLPRGSFVTLLVLHAVLNDQKDLSLRVEN